MPSIHQHESNPEFRVQGASLGLTNCSDSTEALGFPLNSEGGTEPCMRACPLWQPLKGLDSSSPCTSQNCWEGGCSVGNVAFTSLGKESWFLMHSL